MKVYACFMYIQAQIIYRLDARVSYKAYSSRQSADIDPPCANSKNCVQRFGWSHQNRRSKFHPKRSKVCIKMFAPSRVVVLCGPAVWDQQCRGMATLKSISLRLKSVKNIQKITQSMKMVSAAKYARAERELKVARPFGHGAQAFYQKIEVQAPEDEKAPKVILAMTSDRGLCGAVHSSVGKLIKNDLSTSAGESTKVVCVGDKSRALLQRLYGGNILLSAKEIGRVSPTFADASKIAQALMDSGYEFSGGKIVYNQFKSVVSYKTTEIPIFGPALVSAAPKLTVYDSVDADVLQSYQEFALASLIFYAMKENACSEQSSRMTAMDNASKNAGEMIDKLSLTFNRTRQAVITRELIEIISGAAALD